MTLASLIRSCCLLCLLVDSACAQEVEARSAPQTTPQTSPIRIKVDLAEVAYDDLGALSNTRSPSQDALDELTRDGKATTLLSHCAELESGDRLTVARARREVIYPEQFGFDAAQTNWAGAAEAKNVVMFPVSFESQQVGAEFEVCPRYWYQPDGTEINVQLSAKVVSPPVWGQIGGEVPIMNGRSPNVPLVYFHTRSVATNLVVAGGSSAIVFGGMDLDGSVLYVMISLGSEEEAEKVTE